jgi:D-glycero-alpha-D-manno-heptose-7-phosphate kinase
VIAGALDRYVYITISRPFEPGIYLKYSEIEHVTCAEDITHPIFCEVAKDFFSEQPQVEITSIADVPAGTGLGSSGSFTTALLKAASLYNHRNISPQELAELACDIEINRLHEPVGKQDQYIAAFGGLTCFIFHKDDTVTVTPLILSTQMRHELDERLLLFFTGFKRKAGDILSDQSSKSLNDDTEMTRNLDFIKSLGYDCKKALEGDRPADFGALMHEHWEHKQKRSATISNDLIQEWYELGRKNGAIGGKLVGAGGGGFLMFYAEDTSRLRNAMTQAGLQEMRFGFDFEGTRGIL